MKAKLRCYSPGMSPLRFCYENVEKNINYSSKTHPVYPSRIVKWLKAESNKHFANYQIYKLEGRWTILPKVERIDERTVKYNGDQYRYRFVRDVSEDREITPNDVRIEFKDCNDEWRELANLSMRNSITWFLRYENILERTRYVRGKRVSYKDSFGFCHAEKETHFPDGDGIDCK